MNIHVVKHLTNIPKAEREKMFRDALGKDLVLELPEGEALSMKADLGLSWFRLNKLRRLVTNYCNQHHIISIYKILPGCLSMKPFY